MTDKGKTLATKPHKGKGKEKAAADDFENVDMYKEFIMSDIKDIDREICWSVACAETVEAHYNFGIVKAEREKLSPQFLLDYVTGDRDFVSHFKKAKKIIENPGLPRHEAYSFIGKRQKKPKVVQPGKKVRITNAIESTEVTEAEILRLMNMRRGPVLVVLDTNLEFAHIKDQEIYQGVTRPPNERKMLHAVVIVGHGQSGGQKFWEICNSYGTTWGKNGYGRISRDVKFFRSWYPTGVHDLIC